MNDQISFQANAETRGTVPVQFFEAAGGDVPAGTKATSRPADRPRELPPPATVPDALQLFESQGPSQAYHSKATPRPTGRENG
jgi:hypothetical protein